VLAELHALAGRLGVAVRAEPFGKGLLQGRGGLCRVDGKAMVVMDDKLGVPERIAVLAEALATFDLEAVTLPPVVRELLAKQAARGRKPRKKRAAPPAQGALDGSRHPGLARARPRARPRGAR